MPVSNADFWNWTYSNRIRWDNQWKALESYEVDSNQPVGMPVSSWKHLLYGKTAKLINKNCDPVEILETKKQRAIEDRDYESEEEWENVHITNGNRAYWKKIVDAELDLIKRYFGSDEDGLNDWLEMYHKYIDYAQEEIIL